MSLKILLIGDGNVGKTSFVSRSTCKKPIIIPSTENSLEPIRRIFFQTSIGEISLDIQMANSIPEDLTGYHGCVVMFSLACDSSYKYAEETRDFLKKRIPDVILCGNKWDLFDEDDDLEFLEGIKTKTPCFFVSASRKYNITAPWLHFIRKFFGQDVKFVE